MFVRDLPTGGQREEFTAGITAIEPVDMCIRFPQIAEKKSYPARGIITATGCIIRPIIRVTIWFTSRLKTRIDCIRQAKPEAAGALCSFAG
jgi:hypothetical protein